MKMILHIDFNSYFATIEQQANPRLRGKPIGVTGGDRSKRTVVCTASVEAKKLGVKTGMSLQQARRVCPQIIIIPGESEKYLECSKRFLNILKDYSPFLEVFSIDESFLELPAITLEYALSISEDIKSRIKKQLGEWVCCSIGISYNKVMAKLASELYKPDGLNAILDPPAAMFVLDQLELDDVCGIGHRIKTRLWNMGVTDFSSLRKVPLQALLATFKSYGQTLYDMSHGTDNTPIKAFYDQEEVKSIGHRHTLDHDSHSELEIKQVLLRLTELVARRLRAKKLLGKTIHFGFRRADFSGGGMQVTVNPTNDGLIIFQACWQIFEQLCQGQSLRLVSISVSHLGPLNPQTLSFLDDQVRQQKIIGAIDKINNIFGEFTLQRAVLLQSAKITRKANPFLSDRRFKI